MNLPLRGPGVWQPPPPPEFCCSECWRAAVCAAGGARLRRGHHSIAWLWRRRARFGRWEPGVRGRVDLRTDDLFKPPPWRLKWVPLTTHIYHRCTASPPPVVTLLLRSPARPTRQQEPLTAPTSCLVYSWAAPDHRTRESSHDRQLPTVHSHAPEWNSAPTTDFRSTTKEGGKGGRRGRRALQSPAPARVCTKPELPAPISPSPLLHRPIPASQEPQAPWSRSQASRSSAPRPKASPSACRAPASASPELPGRKCGADRVPRHVGLQPCIFCGLAGQLWARRVGCWHPMICWGGLGCGPRPLGCLWAKQPGAAR